jgi:2-haloacid dehalogenase
MTDLDYGRFDALTFDCYGTLVDWEAGILAALRRALSPHGVGPHDDELLEVFAGLEASAEAGPYLRYREILGRCLRGIGARYEIRPDGAAEAAFGDSVGDWPTFADSSDALRLLHGRFRLGVITNCDDDLFARSEARLGVTFDWVVTAQSVGSYKPDPRNFEAAFERMDVPRERILHVAPVPRPRAGQAPRTLHGLDRPPSRSIGIRGHPARRSHARRHLPRHGRLRLRGNNRLRNPALGPPGQEPGSAGRTGARPPRPLGEAP